MNQRSVGRGGGLGLGPGPPPGGGGGGRAAAPGGGGGGVLRVGTPRPPPGPGGGGGRLLGVWHAHSGGGGGGMVIPLLAASLLSSTAMAASLRPLTTLAAPVVRLSDLFDDAGPDSARVLGTAPVPGARIVVEAAQLAAIARQFGVDWRPSSASDRAVR